MAEVTERITKIYQGEFDSDFPWRVEWSWEPWDAAGRVGWVDWKLWEIVAEDDDGPMYDCQEGGRPMHSHEPGEPIASGHLKWDGCNEMDWGLGAAHACGLEDRAALHRAVERVLGEAARFMGDAWDWDPPETEPLTPHETAGIK